MAKNKLLTIKEPEKASLVPLKKRAGRSHSGRISVRSKGGGVKRLYRLIDFGQSNIGKSAKAIALEYDPNRTSFIALLEYEDGKKKYILAPQNFKIGDKIIEAEQADIQIGNRMKLKNIPVGTMVYNIEFEPGRGGKMVRSAGAAAKVLAQEGKYTHLEMPSKETRKLLGECYASIGMVSNQEHIYEIKGKAGTSRLMGIRPHVRGTAMNPPDHPHGGGEGRSSVGLKYPKTPWGKHAMGVRTRKSKWTDRYILKRRYKK
jgi:large subunit ribosomal protein L2